MELEIFSYSLMHHTNIAQGKYLEILGFQMQWKREGLCPSIVLLKMTCSRDFTAKPCRDSTGTLWLNFGLFASHLYLIDEFTA